MPEILYYEWHEYFLAKQILVFNLGHDVYEASDILDAAEKKTINGVVYQDGLGTHAPGRVRYHLAGRYDRLEGAVGRDFRAWEGEAEAEIWVDDVRVFASGTLTRHVAAVPFELDLTGAQELELVILEGDDTRKGDHVDWVDVRLR